MYQSNLRLPIRTGEYNMEVNPLKMSKINDKRTITISDSKCWLLN